MVPPIGGKCERLRLATTTRNDVAEQLLADALAALVVKAFHAEAPRLDEQGVDLLDGKSGRDVDVERLALVDELLTNGGLQNNFVLRDFLEGLEDFLFTLGEEIKMLHRALIEHDVAPNLFVVTAFLVQKRFEIAIFANEIAFGQSGLVVVGRIGLHQV